MNKYYFILSCLIALLPCINCAGECEIQFTNGICVNGFDPSLTNDTNYIKKLELATDYLILFAEWEYDLNLQEIINKRGMTINFYTDKRDHEGMVTILPGEIIMELNQAKIVAATPIAHEFMHIYFWFAYNKGDMLHQRPEWTKGRVHPIKDYSFEMSLAKNTAIVIGDGWILGECMNSDRSWDQECIEKFDHIKK